MGIPLSGTCWFLLVAFNILFLSWIFVNLINMCLCILLGFILYGIFWAFWTWMSVFIYLFIYFSHVRKVDGCYRFHFFPLALFFCLHFLNPYNGNVDTVKIFFQRSLIMYSFFVSFVLFHSNDFHHSFYSLFILLHVLVYYWYLL